jgi:cytochrome c
VRTAEEYLAEPEFAAADPGRGELLSLACIACHTLRAGEAVLLGPNLSGFFGREAATQAGFEYSPALAASGIVWTPRAVDAWLANPSSFVPGTSMVFAGYASAQDRRDLIAYLLHATSGDAQ